VEEKQNERLIAEDVHLHYQGVHALRGCGVTVSPGKAVVLVGPSGAGKSTLLWLLAGLRKPDDGRVGVVDHAGQCSAIPAGELGMVFQQPMLWEHLSVEQHLNLVLAGKGLSRPQRRRQTDATLSRMMLQSFRRRLPGQLSGGERQRLAIARAIVAQPRWLLLDEPLAHLDGPTRAELLDLLREILREIRAGVVLATHNATDALRLGDELCVMLAGEVAQRGTGRDVYRKPIHAAVARVLGPACVLDGWARDGTFRFEENGQPVVTRLDASLSGKVTGLLRPDDLCFHVEEGGPAGIIEVEYLGNGYSLLVDLSGGEPVSVFSKNDFAKGTPGTLSLSQPNAGYWQHGNV
jgi:ABC-type Fe3+/spermidine/putrescine transport system ATPase subunit